ncbi:MAG: hypothetical protein V3T56_08680 [Gemmatimonadales bacterium]
MNLEYLLERGEAFHRELGREYYETGAGLKDNPAFQAIYQRYASLTSPDALDVAKASGDPALHEWVIDLQVGRELASLDEEQLRWEQSATVDVGDQQIPYLKVPIELANAEDRQYRIALDNARADAGCAGLEQLRRDRFVRERELIEGFGHGQYVEALGTLTAIDLDALAAEAQAFLDRTTDMYHDGLQRMVKRHLGLGMDDLLRSDSARLFRHDRFDDAFAASRLVEVAVEQMGAMGLDATQSGRVRFDTEEREGKQPRAFCVPVVVPDEVYLVLRPQGGHGDYRTFWHELGHAMHFASVPADLPFAARWLGDNSVTEGFAMLWDHLTMNRGWLDRYIDLPTSQVRELVFELAVGELFLVRRYAAKISYELDLYRGDFGGTGERYVDRLSAATGFRYLTGDALLDVDPGFYSARYLRAWQLESMLAMHLKEQFDEDWYRNPHAGDFVLGLMQRGQGDPANRLAEDVLGQALTFDHVVHRLEELLN